MLPNTFRRTLTAALATVILFSVSAEAAGKRRAVTPRSPGVPFTVELISGQVLDNVTGQPIVSAEVWIGNRSDVTDAQGRFDIKNAAGQGFMTVEIMRSGYQPFTGKFLPNDSRTMSVRLNPTQTVMVRETNGTVHHLDIESVKFGYPVPFSGYRESEAEDFCTANGTTMNVHRGTMAKLTGPAVIVAGGACCTAGNAAKMTLTLKSGVTQDVIFTDTCEERYKVDIGGREHVSAKFVHILITDIAEIVFP
jgi:hypothetical protein